MSHKQTYEATDWDYGTDSFQTIDRIKTSKRRRPVMGRKRGKAPQWFNGMHRRRKRKFTW